MMREKGQSFYELLVAVVIVGLVLVALAKLSVSALGKSNYSRYQALSSRYSQEAIEWLRLERDNNWTVFAGHASTWGRTWCFQNLSGWPGSSGACGGGDMIAGTPLSREAILTSSDDPAVPGDPDRIEAVVITYWIDSSGRHEARATTVFTNWKRR